MGSFSIWHWLVVGAIVLLLFGGKGKISDIMGDIARGIKSFKKGMAEEEESTTKPPSALESPPLPPSSSSSPSSVPMDGRNKVG